MSEEALQIAEKRSERQGRNPKIYPTECRVAENSKERLKNGPGSPLAVDQHEGSPGTVLHPGCGLLLSINLYKHLAVITHK